MQAAAPLAQAMLAPGPVHFYQRDHLLRSISVAPRSAAGQAPAACPPAVALRLRWPVPMNNRLRASSIHSSVICHAGMRWRGRGALRRSAAPPPGGLYSSPMVGLEATRAKQAGAKGCTEAFWHSIMAHSSPAQRTAASQRLWEGRALTLPSLVKGRSGDGRRGSFQRACAPPQKRHLNFSLCIDLGGAAKRPLELAPGEWAHPCHSPRSTPCIAPSNHFFHILHHYVLMGKPRREYCDRLVRTPPS
jgi:hypothetical protein